MKTKIILVGNAQSILNEPRGHEIDQFETVVRFNNFVLEPKEYTGEKFSIHARRSCDDIKLWSKDSFQKLLCFVTYCNLTPGMERVARQVQGMYKDKCKIINARSCKTLAEDIGLVYPQERASVGALAIGYFLTKYDAITLHGFSDGEPDKHYFKKPPKDGHYHNWTKERDYIDRFLGKKIFFL